MNEQPNETFTAHRCHDGILRPYPVLFCSLCRQSGENIDFKNRAEYEAVKTKDLESSPFMEGTFSFEWLDECDQLIFNPPLEIEWRAWSKDGVVTVYVDYDFGLTDKFRPYESINKGWYYGGIDKDTPLADIVKEFIRYDLFHAFCHTSLDPNYGHLHWALYGNLKDRVTVIESPIDFS